MSLTAFSDLLPEDALTRVLAVRENDPLNLTAYLRADNDNGEIYQVHFIADLDALVAANTEFQMCMGADDHSVAINETQIDCERSRFDSKASIARFTSTMFDYALKGDFIGALCQIQNHIPGKRERNGKFKPEYAAKRSVYKHG